MDTPNPHDYRAIQNILSLYCIALDSKDFGLLNRVFVKDVVAIYPFNDEPILGVEKLSGRIRERLTPVTTQHALTTQYISIEGQTAVSTTYFTGIHFGTEDWVGRNVVAYGKYVDEFICMAASREEGEEGGKGEELEVKGASGNWRIKKREVVFFGRVGEEGVMRH